VALVAGHPELTSHAKLDWGQPAGDEVGEQDLRYSYEQQQHSPSADVMPAPREQPPFAPNIVLRYPTAYISLTPPSLTNDRRRTNSLRSNESRPGARGGFHLLTTDAYISAVLGHEVGSGRVGLM
jgi:hypothetical protein